MNIQQKLAPQRARTPTVWLQEIETGLPVRAQLVVSGNVRDIFPVRMAGHAAFLPAPEALWGMLSGKGYAGLLRYDPVTGLSLHHECDPAVLPALAEAGIEPGAAPRDFGALAGQLRRVANHAAIPLALVLDYASQLCGPKLELRPDERDFLIACDQISRATRPLAAKGRPAELRYNPILWLVDRPTDLPDWFTVGNESIQTVCVPLPDLEERFALARASLSMLPGGDRLSAEAARRGLEDLAIQTGGMTLRAVRAVHELARAEGIGLADIGEAIRAYRVGTRRNPWKSEVMRRRIADGRRLLTERVKGQDHAVQSALDILVRSVMGLSGARGMVKKVLDAVQEEHGVEIILSDRMMSRIEELCTVDLFNGGRGIGNRLETVFVNPLAQLLFGSGPTRTGQLRVAGVDEEKGRFRVRLRCCCEEPTQCEPGCPYRGR